LSQSNERFGGKGPQVNIVWRTAVRHMA
jgi:hypothetical protein